MSLGYCLCTDIPSKTKGLNYQNQWKDIPKLWFSTSIAISSRSTAADANGTHTGSRVEESSLCAGLWCLSLTYCTNFLSRTFPLGCGFKNSSSGWCNKLLLPLACCVELLHQRKQFISFKARGDHYNNFTCHALETEYIIQKYIWSWLKALVCWGFRHFPPVICLVFIMLPPK